MHSNIHKILYKDKKEYILYLELKKKSLTKNIDKIRFIWKIKIII